MSGPVKALSVVLTAGAAKDLRQIYRFILFKDGANRASDILVGIEHVVNTISQFPHRGSVPREIQVIGKSEFRQVFYKSYRIIYRVAQNKVIIYIIVDGRQDMATVLSRRLSGIKR